MNQLTMLLAGMALIMLSCNPPKTLVTKEKLVNREIIGHLKMGLLDYQILDTANTTVETAEMMIGMMKPAIEIEEVFNSTRSAELIVKDNEYVRRFLYDRATMTHYEFNVKDSVPCYSKLEMGRKMAEVETSDEEIEELSRMLKVRPYDSINVEILGFRCDEVTMFRPPEYTEIYTMAYTSSKIPHMSEAMGAMSKYFTGAPLKTVMFINGIKITTGAVEYNENESMAKYLDFDSTQYQRVSEEEMEMLRSR